MDVHDKLASGIFSILEKNFLFGYNDNFMNGTKPPGPSGKVRVLTIDDSGDGVLAATALLHLQTILRLKTGNPKAHVSDFFDVVAGSGVGGILSSLLFTRGKDTNSNNNTAQPLFTAEESLKFVAQNYPMQSKPSTHACLFPRSSSKLSKVKKLLNKVFAGLTLRDTLKPVLIPCYDLATAGAFVFSRADALGMEGCDFDMAGVCAATLADRAVEIKSVDGMTRLMALGGGIAMTNPTAAAITHVLNNKQEFPLCNGVEDLLVVSLGKAANDKLTASELVKDGAADMVDQAVSMAFGEWRTSNYLRIQGNGMIAGMKGEKLKMAEEILKKEKNVESVLFRGKKIVELTNMEKLEIFGGKLIKEQERRKNNSILPTVLLKSSTNNSPRSSSATTISSSLSS